MLNAGIMTDDEFESILVGKNKICICDFSASWCGPCRLMAPIMEDISEKYKKSYYFYQIDIDSAEEIAKKYNIVAVPTMIIFKDGKELGRTSGYQDFEEFEKFMLDTIENAENEG